MARGSVDGDSEEFGVELPELGIQLSVESQLVAADGAPIRGVDAQYHGPAQKISERDMLIRRRLEGEVWRLGAGLQRRDVLVFRLKQFHLHVCPCSLTVKESSAACLAQRLTASAAD